MTLKNHANSQNSTDDKLHQRPIEAGIKKGLDDVRQGRVSPFTIDRAERLKQHFKSQSK